MSGPRLLITRNVNRAVQQTRSLHMTGPATFTPILNKEPSVLNLPRDVAGLRSEAKRRQIDATGSKKDLIARINADELAHSRAFSTAAMEPKKVETKPSVRHFNTSRSLKANNDSSTIDFAYLPSDVLAPQDIDIYSQVRVPIIPTPSATSSSTVTTHHNALAVEPEETVVMKPQINTMSADAVYLPMAESTDGHGMNIDFHAMADRVALNLKRMSVPVEEQASLMKRIWGDMVDDVMGLKKATA